jgi:preprotein translocase subunit YajC
MMIDQYNIPQKEKIKRHDVTKAAITVFFFLFFFFLFSFFEEKQRKTINYVLSVMLHSSLLTTVGRLLT